MIAISETTSRKKQIVCVPVSSRFKDWFLPVWSRICVQLFIFFLFGHILTLAFTGKSMLKTSCFVMFSTKYQFLVSSFSCLLLYCPLPLLSRKFCLVFQFVTKIPLDFRLTSSEFPLTKKIAATFWQVTIFHHFKKLWVTRIAFYQNVPVSSHHKEYYITDIPVGYKINCFIYLNINSRL